MSVTYQAILTNFQTNESVEIGVTLCRGHLPPPLSDKLTYVEFSNLEIIPGSYAETFIQKESFAGSLLIQGETYYGQCTIIKSKFFELSSGIKLRIASLSILELCEKIDDFRYIDK